jgi:hypothetical protein
VLFEVLKEERQRGDTALLPESKGDFPMLLFNSMFPVFTINTFSYKTMFSISLFPSQTFSLSSTEFAFFSSFVFFWLT